MSRTNIEIDDGLIRRVMERYDLRSKREAVDFALRQLDITPFTREEILALEGTGWDGDLDEIKRNSPAIDAWIGRE